MLLYRLTLCALAVVGHSISQPTLTPIKSKSTYTQPRIKKEHNNNSITMHQQILERNTVMSAVKYTANTYENNMWKHNKMRKCMY